MKDKIGRYTAIELPYLLIVNPPQRVHRRPEEA